MKKNNKIRMEYLLEIYTSVLMLGIVLSFLTPMWSKTFYLLFLIDFITVCFMVQFNILIYQCFQFSTIFVPINKFKDLIKPL